LTEPLKLPRDPPPKLIIGTESEDQLLEERPAGREVLLLGRRRVDRRMASVDQTDARNNDTGFRERPTTTSRP